MAYRFKLAQTPGKQLPRMAREQIDRAVGIVSQPHTPFAVRVHAARTATKRIRAVLRIVQVRRSRIWRTENTFFRDAARQLATLREAAVMPTTVELLRQRAPLVGPRDFAALQRWTQVHSRRILAKRAANLELLRRFARAMRRARRRTGRLETHLGVTDFVAGFRCSYHSARVAWSRLDAKSNAARYHELRKRVKTHAYHCRLFRKAWPKMLRAQQCAFDELDDLLGNEHDLALLALRLKQHSRGNRRKAVKSWLRLIAARQKDFRREALWLGQRIFVMKPSVVEDSVSTWWFTARAKKCGRERRK